MSDEFIINPSRMNGYPSFNFLPSEFNELSMTSKYFFKINNDYLNSYPSFLKNFSQIQTPPYPKYLFTCKDDYLDGYPSFLKNFPPIQTPPYPRYLFACKADYLNSYPSFLKNFPPTQTPPYPVYLFTCEDDYLNGYPSFRKECVTFGAFQFAETLNKIVIPRTVKFISDYTFYGTNIKKATIAPDCKYFEHSFPEECQIEFYEE